MTNNVIIRLNAREIGAKVSRKPNRFLLSPRANSFTDVLPLSVFHLLPRFKISIGDLGGDYSTVGRSIFLGFALDGYHLLAYQRIATTHEYMLEVWFVDATCSIKKSWQVPLFRTYHGHGDDAEHEQAPETLQIQLLETADSSCFGWFGASA